MVFSCEDDREKRRAFSEQEIRTICADAQAREVDEAVEGVFGKNLARPWLRCRDEEEAEANAATGERVRLQR
jgi:hypothetical protein